MTEKELRKIVTKAVENAWYGMRVDNPEQQQIDEITRDIWKELKKEQEKYGKHE